MNGECNLLDSIYHYAVPLLKARLIWLNKEFERLFDENEGYERSLQAAASRDRVDFVTILPFEVTEAIFSYLSVRDLRSCSAVSVSWHEMSNSSRLWRQIAEDGHFRHSGVKNQSLDKDQLTSVDSNFLNELKRFRVPMDSVRLSPMNDWKRFHCQYNFLLYNWERGFFAAHVLTFPRLIFSNRPIHYTTRVTFPSTLPKDRIFLPYQYRNHSVASLFYLLRLDDNPKIACELNVGVVPIACVNRDCFVFIHRKKVESLKLDENNVTSFRIKTVGELFTTADYNVEEECDKGVNYFLNMDDEVIVAGFKYTCIKIWCKATHTLRKTFNLQYKYYFSYCHFHDSTVYFSSWTANNHLQQPEAELKICDLEEDKVNRIVMRREVTKVCSNERYFLTVTKLNVNSNVIEVRERDDYSTVTMTVEQDNSENWGIAIPVVLLCGERVLYLEAMTIKVMSLALNAVFDVCNVRSVIGVEKLVGDLLMVRLRDKIEVWDWKRGMRLYTPVLECPMDHDVYCDDTRMVVVNPNNEVKVIGFW